TDAAIHPGASDVPNGGDDDCDGVVDEVDVDNDGFLVAVDCDDSNAGAHPGATEVPYNFVDENCDGVIENDGDNDAFNKIGAPSGGPPSTDCDDFVAAIHPGATEIKNNNIDE